MRTADGQGVVGFGVYGYRDPSTGEFSPVNNVLSSPVDGAISELSDPYLLSMPEYSSGPLRFGPDRDATAAVRARLIGARDVRGVAATPAHLVYPNVLLQSSGDAVTADLVGVFDGQGNYSDFLVVRAPQQYMSFSYQLELQPGITAHMSDTGGVDFVDQTGNVIVRASAPHVTDSSAPAHTVPAQYVLDGNVLQLLVYADPTTTVAPILVDPEWEVRPPGDDYRCVKGRTGNDCRSAPEDGETTGYISLTDVPFLPFGTRISTFDCSPPDDQTANIDRRLTGDSRSTELCINSYGYKDHAPTNARWSVVHVFHGPQHFGIDGASWYSVALSWCSGNVDSNRLAGLELGGVDNPESTISGTFASPARVISGGTWQSFSGNCDGFPAQTSTDPPRDNGVIYDYANRRHIPIVTGDDTTNGIGPGAHREDLYAGLFSKAAETTTNQESRLAVVERIWLDSLNATIKPGSFDLTSNDQGFHRKPVGGVIWSDLPSFGLKVDAADNLSGVHEIGSKIARLGGAFSNLSPTTFSFDPRLGEVNSQSLQKTLSGYADGPYVFRANAQDFAHWSGQNLNEGSTNYNPFARNGSDTFGPTNDSRFNVDTYSPAVANLGAAENPAASGEIDLSWNGVADPTASAPDTLGYASYHQGIRRFLWSPAGSCAPVSGHSSHPGCFEVDGSSFSPTVHFTPADRHPDPCAARSYTFNVWSQDNSPYQWVSDPRSVTASVDNRVSPQDPTGLGFTPGAAGAIVDWSAVPAVDAACPGITYEYKWSDNSGFSGTGSQYVSTLHATSDTVTQLMKRGTADWPACTRMWVRVRAVSVNGLSSNWGKIDHLIDCRPTIDRADGAAVRYDSLNGTVYANGTTSRDLVVRVADQDGAADLTDASVISSLSTALSKGQSPDFARVVLDVSDPNGNAPTTDGRADPDASATITWAFGQLDASGNAVSTPRVTLTDAGGSQSCDAGTATTLAVGYWTMPCASLLKTDNTDAAGVVTSIDLTFPLRPRDDGKDAANRFPTPDQLYDVSGHVRDRAQPADYRFLANDATNTQTATPAAGYVTPPASASNAFSWIDLGDLVLDRVLPAATWIYPNVDPTVNTSSAITLSINAWDRTPSAATTPTTRDATGLQTVEYRIYDYNTTTLRAGPFTATCAIANAIDAPTNACAYTWNPTLHGNFTVEAKIIDNAGNHIELTRQLVVPWPDPCFNGTRTYFGQYPHVEPTAPTFTANWNIGPTAQGSDPFAFGTFTPADPAKKNSADKFQRGDSNLHIQCEADHDPKVARDWNGEASFVLANDLPSSAAALSIETPAINSQPKVQSGRMETQSSWKVGTDIYTITVIRITLRDTSGVTATNAATLQLLTRTTGGLKNGPQTGEIQFWIWPGSNIAGAATYTSNPAPITVNCQGSCTLVP